MADVVVDAAATGVEVVSCRGRTAYLSAATGGQLEARSTTEIAVEIHATRMMAAYGVVKPRGVYLNGCYHMEFPLRQRL